MPRPTDLTGRVSGRLVVLHEASPSVSAKGRAYRRILCRCECGKEVTVFASNFTRGHTRSCGCFGDESRVTSNTTHGHSSRGHITSEMHAYRSMISRCTKPANKLWYRYGGRGITVCERWLASFENFLADMGPKPSPGHSIDRKDNDRGYGPDNCHWATKVQQARNTCATRWLEHNGERRSLAEWAEIVGLKPHTLWFRIARGWTIERALTERAFIGKNQSSAA